MNKHLEAIEMRENLKTALMQCYDMLIAKMQSDPYQEGKIFRLAVAVGQSPEGDPLQLILEINLQEKSFHPLHSIVTLKELPYNLVQPYKTVNPQYAIQVEDLFSLSKD